MTCRLVGLGRTAKHIRWKGTAVKKDYQRNASRAAMSEIEIPDVVSVAMSELTGAVKEGLLALAVGAGLQVMQVATASRCGSCHARSRSCSRRSSCS